MGAGQLAGDRDRLRPGPDRLAREDDRRAAPQRAVALHAVLPRRGLRRRQPLAVHRRGAARGAEVLPRDTAGRRGAPRRLLSALHAGGRRPGRRDHRRRAARHGGPAHLGPSEGLRPARRDGRGAPARPFQAQARRRRHAVPHRHRGQPRPARPAHDRALPRGVRPAAGLPRGHAPRRARRAAPHRLRRPAPGRPVRGGRDVRGRGRRDDARGPAVDRVACAAAERRSPLHRVLRLHARGSLRGRARAPRRRACGRSACPSTTSRASRCRWTCRRASAPSAG